jgi:F-type H+-transporting ATPase subunit a
MFLTSPFEQFELSVLYPVYLAFTESSDLNVINGLDLSFTNSSLYLVIMISFFWFISSQIAKHSSLNPKTFLQIVFETLYQALLTIVSGNIGTANLKYFPFLATIFVFIGSLNLIGMVPYSFTVTSHISITFALAFSVCVALFILSIRLHGLVFFKSFLPEGTPLPLAPLLITIELVSYTSHSISLSVRLFANMLSGHALLKILSGFVAALAPTSLYFVAVAPFAVVFALTGMEFCIALLQAYVFTVLTSIYLKDAIYPH